VREIRMLRAMWRALETKSRNFLNGHEGGNAGYGQERSYGFTRQRSTLPGVASPLVLDFRPGRLLKLCLNPVIWATQNRRHRQSTNPNQDHLKHSFYISNVEGYLNSLWPQYRANLAALPTDASTLLIRVYPLFRIPCWVGSRMFPNAGQYSTGISFHQPVVMAAEFYEGDLPNSNNLELNAVFSNHYQKAIEKLMLVEQTSSKIHATFLGRC
jgi:hypothetical protein